MRPHAGLHGAGQLAGGARRSEDIYARAGPTRFTGKERIRRRRGRVREEKEQQTPRAPSEIRDGIDPIVERLITRCLDRDPRARPGSAAQLAAALPGGDPLAAAIAAGETPSPGMVAASGLKEGLRPGVAWGLLSFIVCGSLAVISLNRVASPLQRLEFAKSPEILVERARDLIKRAGYGDQPTDSAFGLIYNGDALTYALQTYQASTRWNMLRASGAILFW